MKSYQIREKAKIYLTGGWRTFTVSSVIYLALLAIFPFICKITNMPYILSLLLQLLVNSIFTYGLFAAFWNYSKGLNVNFYDFILLSFKNIKRSLMLLFHTVYKLIFPFILTIASNILISSSMRAIMYYSMSNSGTSIFLNLFLIFSIALFIFSIIFFFIKSLNYSLNNLVAIENTELTEKECVKKSQEIMHGNKLNYLKLLISFAGWFIVGIFTLLIGFIWIFPYFEMSLICFYENAKDNKNIKRKSKNKKKK